MPVNRIALRDAERALRHQSTRMAEEIRALRIRAGLSQAAVAREVGVSRSAISKLELGYPGSALRLRFRVATVLGGDLRLSLFAESGPHIRDTAQARIVEWLLIQADPARRPTVEATVPGPGRRSVDLRFDGPADIVLIEVETHVASLEEIIRELHSKREAVAQAIAQAGSPARGIHVVLALPSSRHHRSIVRAHPRIITAAFPISSIRLARALTDSLVDWPGDGILWIP